MTINKKQAVAVLAVALTVAAAGIGSVYADSEAQDKANPMNGLISAIASKFNLDAGEVREVFDEQRTKMNTQREKNFADRLAKAVQDGKITDEQASLIKDKQAQLQQFRQNLRTGLEGKTAEERQSAMKEEMAGLKQWAEDNDIPEEFIMMGGRGGRPGPGGPGRCLADSDEASQAD